MMKSLISFALLIIFFSSSCNFKKETQEERKKPLENKSIQSEDQKNQESTIWRNGTNGYYPDKELLDQWPAEGPDILWSFESLGKGHSSAAPSGEYLYVTGMTEGEGFLYKLDLQGKLIYKESYGPEFNESWYGSRGTPVIAGDKIYYVSGYGKIMCLNENNGNKIWEVDMVNDLKGDTITWGYNETPVINGELIYCTPGGKNSVVALNRYNGELVWSCRGEGELAAYCTPLLFEHNGRKILTTHTASHLLGIDALTGELLWTQYQPNQWSVHANTPIYHNGEVFFFSGYGQGGGMLKLNEDGSKAKLMWNTNMDSRIGGAVLIDGYIYGSGDAVPSWRCIEWDTGKDMYQSDTIAKGAVIAADNKLICYSERGELALVNATPEKFDIVSKIQVTKGSEQHWAHPVIYRGVLYLRHGKALIAYKVK